MSVAIVCATRDRQHLIPGLVSNLRESTDIPFNLYFATGTAETDAFLAGLDVQFQRHHFDATAIQKYNWLFAHTTEDYIYMACDDVYYYPGWLEAAMAVMQVVDGIVSIADGLRPDGIGTTFLASRHYLETLGATGDESGYIFHKGYRHNFCETELFATAASRGRFAHARESRSLHRHHLNGLAAYDDTYAKADRDWSHDEQLFASRQHLWT